MTTLSLNIGAPVYCKGACCGTLRKVVVDHDGGRITDLIVERGSLHEPSRVVPVALASDTSGEGVHLSISEAELETYPECDGLELDDATPQAPSSATYTVDHEWAWYDCYGMRWTDSLQPHAQVVVQGQDRAPLTMGRGTHVVHAGAKLGTLDHVLVNTETSKIAYLIIRSGVFPSYRMVNVDAVEGVRQGQVTLSLGSEKLKSLPRYTPRPPRDLQTDVTERLGSHGGEFSQVRASVENSVVYLTGSVPSIAAKRRAEAIACDVPGAIDVVNRLEADSTVTARVLSALHEAAVTRLAIIDVDVDQGVTLLRGSVDSRRIRALAEKIAAEQAGVREVRNRLQVDADENTTLLLGRTSDAFYQLEHRLSS